MIIIEISSTRFLSNALRQCKQKVFSILRDAVIRAKYQIFLPRDKHKQYENLILFSDNRNIANIFRVLYNGLSEELQKTVSKTLNILKKKKRESLIKSILLYPVL